MKLEIKQKDNQTWIALEGAIDETIPEVLSGLHSQCKKNTVFNFKLIDEINSLGVRAWIFFHKSFEEGRSVVFEECPHDIILQINMIDSFKGSAAVRSFYGNFSCENCSSEQTAHFLTKDYEELLEELVSQKCPNCPASMDLDEDEETFLRFLT